MIKNQQFLQKISEVKNESDDVVFFLHYYNKIHAGKIDCNRSAYFGFSFAKTVRKIQFST